MRFGAAFLTLMRPWNMIMVAAAVWMLLFFLNPNSFYWLQALPAGVLAALTLAAGNVLNDITDVKADQVNHPDRFLVRFPYYTPYAWLLFGFLIIVNIIIVCSLPLDTQVNFWFLGGVVGLTLVGYSLWLKKVLIVGNLTVAVLAASVVPFSVLWVKEVAKASIQRPEEMVLGYALLIFFLHFSREVAKSLADTPGDRRRQAVTYQSKGWWSMAQKLCQAGLWSTVVVLIVMILEGWRSTTPLLGIITGTILALALISSYLIYRMKTPEKAKQVQSLQKWTMAVGILSLVCWKS
ncbi:MAG: UbiA family prenyltransferase [Flavobacteriales bacterium]|nr:UbiA family prenyltransferase [Flavobacteriales bacterium]MCX7769107.1 UbiA family prenyltransferase [Flavobacteriales bacterium]MDW8409851.1 UbiA family prenyltransferase [Flavobacteriales bacterium]